MSQVSKAVSVSPLECLIEDALHHLQGLGYSSTYLRSCRGVWRTFAGFAAQEANDDILSEHLVTQFLRSRGLSAELAYADLSSRQRVSRAAMRILTEFHLHGCYQRPHRTQQHVTLPPRFHGVLEPYDAFCREYRRCQPSTRRIRQRHLTQFLHFLDAHGVPTCAAIEPQHLSGFVRSQIHLQPKTLATIVSDLRSFLRFLCMENLIEEDLSPHVPKVRIPRDARIPSVWRPQEVEALLAAVDRSSPKGKRDYAILLLACRLGLRVSDIRTLRLEQLRWDESRLDLVQTKTGEPLSLPLTEEVGQALIDYLQHGRPVTPYREVFLRLHAPLEPLGNTTNLHYLITFYRRRAGIALPAGRRQGLHSLRHSMATRLLEAETPVEVISAVLGHRSLESTQIYLKVDVESLRSAALELEEVSHD
jgi:site-specific recombinase XerD